MRRLPIYLSDRINATWTTTAETMPGASDVQVARACAEVLTGGMADDIAADDAATQVMDWLRERRARGNWMGGW